MATPLLVSLGANKAHVCRSIPCPTCYGAPAGTPARPYHCGSCDVYGKGWGCWSCGSAGVEWRAVPRNEIPV